MSKNYDVVIVGAGIIGLATARALLASGVRRVGLLEAEAEVASHQTSHNSGVIHSGLYYKPGSLKAANCVAGRDAMYRFCDVLGIPHRRSGKLVVATRENELAGLRELERRGIANGLKGLRTIGIEELREMEPEVDGIAGLWIREAGIVNYGMVAAALASDVQRTGAELRTGARLESVRRVQGGLELSSSAGDWHTGVLINCAGLQCDRIARMCGVDPGVMIVPFRGEYYELVPEARGLVRNPIYPVPDPALPFLGVHLTPTIDGRVEAGPNAVLAWKREGYRKNDFSMRDLAETLGYRGFHRLAVRQWRTAITEMARSYSKARFVRDLQRLVPNVTSRDLVPGKSGVRAQAVDRTGRLLDDFHIVASERMIHVLNAPSPAATASLSIGQQIAQRALDTMSLASAAA
jgi:(S)-2-hydroxyglutarate dehydrogenase